jgi:alpha-tubulin suppressor-like RCC1 family protein
VEFSQRVAQVSCGYQHLCVVTEGGEAWVWGLEQKKPKFRTIGTTESARGEQSNLPIKINVPNVRQISCANDYITLTDAEGRVFVVGDLAVKGVNGTQAKGPNDPVQLDLPPITKVASGINYSLALDEDGRVHVWGNNTYGQLGTGGRNASEPVMLESLIR